jgi:hypothetical protein
MTAALLVVSYTTQYMPVSVGRELTIASAFVVPIILTMPIMYFSPASYANWRSRSMN